MDDFRRVARNFKAIHHLLICSLVEGGVGPIKWNQLTASNQLEPIDSTRSTRTNPWETVHRTLSLNEILELPHLVLASPRVSGSGLYCRPPNNVNAAKSCAQKNRGLE